ncbi:MAG: peptidase [Thiomonas sp.]|uniref:Proteasome-type protease n=1 Tax=mine drainage metagenome TaxID=410659 RepID=E6PMS5_9ZZZZ|nr:peptidase [Thiomonas sp. X19]SCC95506.1 20S proteasome, A and B subunits [Thiomonas sp. X19]
MTYCCAVKLNAGLVFASDSRTNAGVDNIGRFSKLHLLERPDERVITMLSSGNLSITQGAVEHLHRAVRQGEAQNWTNAQSMADVAQLLGEAMRAVRERDEPYLAKSDIDAHASFLLGGQIRGERPRLFLVYSEGNAIEATAETPFLQIGEVKYGKPILDRVIRPEISLLDATKCVLVSFDSTMRSNVGVGLPIDLLLLPANHLRGDMKFHIDEQDAYWRELSARWAAGVRRVFAELPPPQWYPDSQQ